MGGGLYSPSFPPPPTWGRIRHSTHSNAGREGPLVWLRQPWGCLPSGPMAPVPCADSLEDKSVGPPRSGCGAGGVPPRAWSSPRPHWMWMKGMESHEERGFWTLQTHGYQLEPGLCMPAQPFIPRSLEVFSWARHAILPISQAQGGHSKVGPWKVPVSLLHRRSARGFPSSWEALLCGDRAGCWRAGLHPHCAPEGVCVSPSVQQAQQPGQASTGTGPVSPPGSRGSENSCSRAACSSSVHRRQRHPHRGALLLCPRRLLPLEGPGIRLESHILPTTSREHIRGSRFFPASLGSSSRAV